MNIEQFLPKGKTLPFDLDPLQWNEQLIESDPDLYVEIVLNIIRSAMDDDLITREEMDAFVKREVQSRIEAYVSRVTTEPIAAWNAKVSTVPIGTDKDDLYLGVEMEFCVVGSQNSIAKKLQLDLTQQGKNRDIICKFDRSVINSPDYTEGFEIVTRPASMLSMLGTTDRNGKRRVGLIEKIMEHSGAKFVAHKTCGLHVHINRKPLTKLQISKMVVFVNAKENVPFIQMIAGRSANEYCKVFEKNYSNALVYEDKKKARYEAVNITNDNTVELRIFAASTDLAVIKARIEFCRALAEYCGGGKNSMSDMNWKKFVFWLENKPKRYAYENLKSYIRTNQCL